MAFAAWEPWKQAEGAWRERTRQSSAFKEAAVAIAMSGAKMMAPRDAEGKGVRLWHMLRKRDHDLPVKSVQSTA